MEQLLTTKLNIPPLRSDLVPRPHLYDLLNEGSNRKLTLVSAPAGFGKSTLVSGWIAESGVQAAWLSLDQGDNDPVRFWMYLIAAIQYIHQEVGVEARQILSAPQLRSTEPVAISLINDVSQLVQDPVVVLDDYHLIEVGEIHQGLSYLLEHQPPNLHLIMITRADPPLSLARLRAHDQLVEVRAGDLQFSSEEAAMLFNDVVNLNLEPEQVETLNRHAEGWIVSLNLAALTLKGQSSSERIIERFTKSHQFILDYLTEEVLESLPDSQRQFLLRTSILERFCAALCIAVSGDPASQKLLDDLRNDNLFLIPLDTENTWFRYHHLFAEVLYALLERDHPSEIGALHLAAAAWLDGKGYPDEAVDHALRSGDMNQARELVLKHWMPVLHKGEVATVQRWLDGLPESKNGSDPSVPLARCWVYFLSGKSSAIEPHLEQAKNAFEKQVSEGSLSSTQQDLVATQLAMMHSVLARGRGDHTKSVAYAEEAARLLPSELMEGIGTQWNMLAAALAGAGDFEGAIEAYERGIELSQAEGNLIGAYGCVYGQTMYLLLQGRLNEAEKLCRSSINRAVSEGYGDIPAAGSLHVALARIKLEKNNLEESGVHLNTGLRIARPGGFGEAVRAGRYLRAHLSAAHGDLDAAAAIIRDTAQIVNAIDDPYMIGELNREWGMLCIKAGDLDAAREKLQILEEKSAETKHGNLLLWRRWLSPRLLYAEGCYEQTLIALDESIRCARNVKGDGELIRLLALQAVALDALGERIPARSALREAVELGAPGGYIWRWMDAGPELGPLLRDLRDFEETSQPPQPYLDSILDAYSAIYRRSTPHLEGELLDPLTPRELEIVRLISKGYSNPEIANQLVVSLNTIKKHTSNIYGKLGVRSRTQAIARAQQLNLI